MAAGNLFPIHLGTSGQFACVRELVRRAEFTSAAVAQFVNIHDLAETETRAAKGTTLPEPADLLTLLVRLFLEGVYVRTATLRGLLSAEEVAALFDLGLVCPQAADESRLYSPIKLYPLETIFVACDRWSNPDGAPFHSPPDILYPPVGPNTRLFLDLLPQSSCEAFLDLCSGTGIAGLIAAKQFAQQAWGYDITERCAHFAEFSRRLNAIENFIPGTGDLYEPAGTQTFDRIVAHPPYVPVVEPKWVFYGGGDDGEQVTRRIIAGLPRFLRPGGSLHCLAMLTEREGQPLEQRVREWLGGGQQDFDVALVTRKSMDPEQFTSGTVLKQAGKVSDAMKLRARFRELKVVALTYSMIMIARRASPRSTFTIRREAGPRTSREEHEWLLAWETQAAQPAGEAVVLNSRLRASERCELLALNRLQDGDWAASGYKLQVDHPFNTEMEMEPWIGLLLPRCKGILTGAELFAELKKDGVLHANTPLEEFVALLKTLISGGFIRVDGASRTEASATA